MELLLRLNNNGLSMSYSNPEVPHTVNVSRENDVSTFIYLTAGIGIIIAAIFLLIHLCFKLLVPYIPFRYETFLVQDNIADYLKMDEKHSVAQVHIQRLADDLARHMAVPQDFSIHIHLSDSAEKNAFATLGGNIIVTQGLIDMISSENVLAMVVGHEIGHIKNRDPLISAGSSILFNLAVLGVTGGNYGVIQYGSGHLIQSSFSRQQESLADELALQAVKKQYGHTQGSEEFFQNLLQDDQGLEFLNSHPNTQKRLQAIIATQNPQQVEKITPLAPEIRAIQNKK